MQPESEDGKSYQEGCNLMSKIIDNKQWTATENTQEYRWTKDILDGHIKRWDEDINNISERQDRFVLGLLTRHSE